MFLSIEDPSCCLFGRVVSIIIMSLIMFSSGCFMIATLRELRFTPPGCTTCEPEQHPVFGHLEAFSVSIFTVEYLARLFAARRTRIELFDQEQLVEIITGESAISS